MSTRDNVTDTGGAVREDDDEGELELAAIERIEAQQLKTTDRVSKLGAAERHAFIDKLLKKIEEDNHRLLLKQRQRIDRVGLKIPTVEVRYKNVSIEAECDVVEEEPLPTLWNTLKRIIFGITKFQGNKTRSTKIKILQDVSGIIKPSRMTLLLGPPGCGKTTLMLALSGTIDKNLEVSGEISYNGYKLNEFIPHKTAAYVSQYDQHISEMTVRETLDFAARCLGIGSRAETMAKVVRREKHIGIIPDPDTDTYMKETAINGLKRTLQTDYILKILGLEICADTIVGNAMRRGISGGQKKRLTTGEMIIGPSKPAPETFDLFDDIILMSEGQTVYHGPRDKIIQFFEKCGFRCPARKGVADFLQEVISQKDQAQFWHHDNQPIYITVKEFARKFKEFSLGQEVQEDLSQNIEKDVLRDAALTFHTNSLRKWEIFEACMAREWVLMKRNSFVHAFKSAQLVVSALITMTVFLRTQTSIDIVDANYFLASLFYSLIRFNSYSPEPQRFFQQILLLAFVNQVSTSLFRLIASIFTDQSVATFCGLFTVLVMFLFCGFIIPQPSLPAWLKWGFWLSPFTYAEIGISVNEFLSPRWQKDLSLNATIGHRFLENHGFNYGRNFYWISIGALFGFWIILNIGFTCALKFSKAPRRFQTAISEKRLSKLQAKDDMLGISQESELPNVAPSYAPADTKHIGMVLPFKPVTLTFENVQYFVDTPKKMREKDIHSPQITVNESLTYSAWLRLPPQINESTKAEFVAEVVQMIELEDIKDALVGIPGVSGLTNEQRKRLTIAVELVSNPSIIFMDEPTSGLDARAAAIVMRAVKNIANTHRTVVCTIHQPSIDIFEAFDELILMKRGGQIIYSGELGQHSSKLIEYFENINKVPKIQENYNPATWMLEITSSSSEEQLGLNFSHIYEKSHLCRETKQRIKELSSPAQGSAELHFSTRFSQTQWEQFKACLWKQNLSYWRSPKYNLVRLAFITMASVILAAILWQKGKDINGEQDLLNILGSIERFAGMYSAWIYSFSQVIIEIPYVILQVGIFVIITYPAIGFLIPEPKIPKWWNWCYWICPGSWSLRGLLTSQYGDIDKEIVAFGEQKAINTFLGSYFGYHSSDTSIVALVLVAFPFVFASIFAYSMAKLNFQRR
ncbi:pleiotropic drug resistance protein 3-like [Heracleum sosnowskyi]|uniref:Pleiotropic drug resistance protein 3-like n=1 Tax=Heracleum sosnowskyi TaxID=360622 RepID=A0AAD8GZ82_9APIA|nr:pleiotropic drug resistance protein 3-like [Heracleum sosnowskyi]